MLPATASATQPPNMTTGLPLLPHDFQPNSLLHALRWCATARRMVRVERVYTDVLVGRICVLIGCGCGAAGHLNWHCVGVIGDE